ncbi:MAG: hypothetical protein NDI61_04685, partial [Bdellovibrionaceae bacterium]|nr:hypothetical protein [Pseudobdellovibrionaceae bacterium]
EFTSPQIKWELSGGKINLGGLVIDSSMMRMTIDQKKRGDVPRRFREGRSTALVTNVSFYWPSVMSRTGRLTAESEAGKVIWSTSIDEGKRADWSASLRSDDDKILKAHSGSPWGILDVDTKSAFLKSGTRFRFCLTKIVASNERFRACSPFHEATRSGDSIRVEPVGEPKTETVFVGKDALGPRATVNFPEGRQIDFKIQFANGAFVLISSRPIPVKFLDVVLSMDGETLILTGQGTKPLGQVKDLQVPPNHFWSATGIETDVVWQMSIPRDTPTLRVLGAWNVPFVYLIRYESLPREDDRIYINTRTGSGTYVDGARIRVLSPQGAKLTSKETKVERRGGIKSKEFRWNFQAKERGKNNRSRIIIDGQGDDSRDWVAHYQLYRGFPFELSGRLTGIVSANFETVLIGEAAAGAWFERFFGSDSYYLSERRWGMNARYFRALQAFAFSGDAASLNEFSVLNVDLRYNLIPGIWNRDELVGLVVSSELIEVAGLKANLAGAGFYWARTMPRIFDDLFNIFFFFRYPKYVDMELIYYPLSTANDVSAGSSYNLNFHGKVFWTPRIYGEAGFGLKRFNYVVKSAESEVNVGTAYGTIGLGFIF